MNRKIYLIGMMILAMLFASCKKEEKTEVQEEFSIMAVTENDGSKTYLDGNRVKWIVDEQNPQNSDVIKVFDRSSNAVNFTCKTVESTGTEANFTSTTPVDDQGEYWAFYPAKQQNVNPSRSGNTFTFKMPDTQYYKDGTSFANGLFPMAAHYPSDAKSGVKLQFKNAFGILRIKATGNNNTITKITVTDNSCALHGTFSFNIDDREDDEKNWGVSAADNSTNHTLTLDLGSGVTLTGQDQFFYIILPPGCLQNEFTVKFFNGNTEVKKATASGQKIARNTMKTAKVDASQVFSFTVDGNGKKVTFSPGNLYIDGTASGNGNKNNYVFKFEAEQYQYRNYIDETHTGVFNWSNSNSASGNGQFGWPGLHWRYPSESPSAYDQGTVFYDWGEAYIMDSKGTIYPPKTWRTLSINEWNYVLNGRNTTNKTYSKWVKVDGKNGIIILPDGSDINLNNYNNIDVSTWKNLEKQGVAFLVAADAGIEYEGSWYTWHNNNSCWYWTSTNTSIDQARHVDSDMPNISASGNSGQGNKMNVRLVKDVN